MKKQLSCFSISMVFEFYFEKCAREGAINVAERDFVPVKKAILERLARKEEPQAVVREVTNAALDEKNLLASTDRLDALFRQVRFNGEAKFRFLRAAVAKNPALATFAI